jgi:hypothetical protein
LKGKLYILMLFISFFWILCDKRKEVPLYVAKINDNYLSIEEIKEKFDSSSFRSRNKIQEYINHWVNLNLLYKEAESRNITNTAEFNALVDEAKKNIAINLFLQKEIYAKTINITPFEIREYYDYHKDEFMLGNEIINISYVVFSSLNAAEEFRRSVLASSWTQNVEKTKKNKMGFISLEDSAFFKSSELSPPDVWKIASNITIGEIPRPIKVLEGYMVLKLNGKQKAGETGDLNYAGSEIKERLTIDKKRKIYLDLLHDLQKKYHPEISNDFIK